MSGASIQCPRCGAVEVLLPEMPAPARWTCPECGYAPMMYTLDGPTGPVQVEQLALPELDPILEQFGAQWVDS